MTRNPTPFFVTVAAALALAACGSDDTAEVQSNVTEVTPDDGQPSSDDEQADTPPDPLPVTAAVDPSPEAALDWELGIPADVPAGEVALPAAGGVRFTMKTDRFIFQDRNFFSVEEGGGAMVGIEIHELLPPGGDPVLTADEALEVISSQADVTPLDESIVVGGVTLAGYRVESGRIGDDVVTGTQFSSADPGGPPQIFWFPGRAAVVYIADAPDGGALLFGYEADDDDNLPTAKAIFDEIAPTLELT